MKKNPVLSGVFIVGFFVWLGMCASVSAAPSPLDPRASQLESGLSGLTFPQAKGTFAILVDKKTNKLVVARYELGNFIVEKTFHATLGQVVGDKEDEGDLKTPEGIYTFKAFLTPPSIKPKFGDMAFYLNYPNVYDQMAGRTGFDIMLHATNEPERLNKNYDSEGCIVVKNDEIAQIKPFIRLGLTPILVFPDLGPEKSNSEWMSPGSTSSSLVGLFESWVRSWQGKEIDKYIEFYHSDFKGNGMNKDQWKVYKTGLNQRYSQIEINPSNIHYYRHPKYSMITFSQRYRSKLKGGSWGHRSNGTKILYIAEENGKPKIISETFSQLQW